MQKKANAGEEPNQGKHFHYTSGIKENELSNPNITSSPNTPSQSSDDTLAVRETTTSSTMKIPLRRSARTMKGIPP